MALQKDESVMCVTREIVFENAYHAISDISGNKSNIIFWISVYEDSTRNSRIRNKDYSFTPDVAENAPNIYKQIYEYLKTTDEYSDAVDVLEEGQNVT